METEHRSRKALVIALGNPLLGIDSFGARVLEDLRLDAPDLARRADLLDAHTDLLAYIGLFANYEQVILVDAILNPQSGDPNIGTVAILEEEALQALSESSPSVHQLSPVLAVKLFRRLYPRASTRISLVGLHASEACVQSDSGGSGGAPAPEAISAGAGKVRELLCRTGNAGYNVTHTDIDLGTKPLWWQPGEAIMANGIQTNDSDKARIEAAVLQQFGLRWAVLGAWRDALRLRNVSLPGDVDVLLESARTKIASGCFSVCSVGCDLSQIEGALTTADSSTAHNWVDFWIDLLGHAMSNDAETERILKVPAVKARYNNCGLTECRC